jgi:hypothetical protein
MPKRAVRTVGGKTHRITWADRHAGYRMKCSCGWIDPKNHWGERGAIEAGNRHVRGPHLAPGTYNCSCPSCRAALIAPAGSGIRCPNCGCVMTVTPR